MTDRYFSQTPITGDRALLAGQEAHHLVHVMRAGPGSRVVLFDGSGAEFAAQVQEIRRNQVRLTVLARREIDRELPWDLTLGVALPKGQRQRWLIEKAVELGAARLVPLITARSVSRPAGPALRRLRRTVIEASKQCGRNRLLEITQPQPWADYVADTADASCRLLAHPGGRPIAPAALPTDPAGPVVLAVGPEGGLTDDEAAQATAAGWQPIDLGPRTLRVETAALLLVAMVCRVPPTTQDGEN